MSIWILYAQHYRQLYLFKLDRILELEKLMGAEQNARFNAHIPTQKAYPRIGPRGHNLDLGVYIIITLAGPGLALVGGSFSAWTVPSLVLTALVSAWVLWQDRRTQDWLAAHRTA